MADLTPAEVASATDCPAQNVVAELARIHAYLADSVPLDPEAAKVLHDNRWELYQS